MPLPFLAALGMQAAGNAVNSATSAGMGLMLERHNDRRQLEQQTRLNNVQIAGDKQLIDYQKAQDYNMWLKTNYSAQVEQLEKAGLNPALMYGMGGGGGTTTGGGGPQVSGGQAPSGGHEVLDAMAIQKGQGVMQLQMMQAQTQLAEAQAKKTDVEAAKIAGVDTENTKSQTQLNIATTGNVQADTKLKEINTKLQQLQVNLQGTTMDDQINYIREETRKMTGEASQALIQANVQSITRKDTIDTIIANSIVAGLNVMKTRAETANIHADTKLKLSNIDVNNQQIKNWVQDNEIHWRYLSDQEKNTAIKSLLADYEMYDAPTQKLIQNFMGGLMGGHMTIPTSGGYEPPF